MKEFSGTRTHRGIQIKLHFCAKTKKEAAKILDISMYELSNYWYCYEPRTKECIENPNIIYSRSDYGGGEARYIKSIDSEKVYPLFDMKRLIDNHRLICETYQESIDFYNTENSN